MKLIPRMADNAAFSRFGTFVEAPAAAGERRLYSDWVRPVDGLAPQLHINHVTADALPMSLDRVERHPRAAQVFLPLDVARYLITVMPAREQDGGPDVEAAISFLVPGTMGVIYRASVWHAGVAVLDRDGRFAVLMWRGAPDDDVFADIPALTVALPESEPMRALR